MRRFGLLGVLLVGLLSVTLLRPVMADGTFTLDFDHEGTGDLTYTFEDVIAHVSIGTLGTGKTGNGAYSTYNGFSGGFYNYATAVAIDLPEDCNLTQVSFWYTGTNSLSEYGVGIALVDSSDATLLDFSFATEHTMNTWFQKIIDTSAYAADTPGGKLGIVVGGGDTVFDAGQFHAVDDIQIICGDGGDEGGRTRPLASADEHPDWGIFDYALAHAANPVYGEGLEVEAFSSNFGASVAAVAAGTVTSVVPFTPDDCSATIIDSLRFCYVAIPGVLTSTSFSQIYTLDMVGNWKVTVEDAIDSSVTYTYVVHAPTVQVGDEVVAGCTIGQTVQIKQWNGAFLTAAATILGGTVTGSLGFLSFPTQAGVTLVSMYQDGEQQSLYPSLTEQPNLADCKEQQLSACVNANPNLSSFAYYDRETDVTLLAGGGVDIPSFNYITQKDIMIDPDADYILTVQARKRETGDDTDSSHMNLQIGSQLDSFDVLPSYHNYTLTTSGDDWHADNFTSIFISNQPSSVASIEVKYVCLAPVTASTAPGSCYFANNEFDSDAAGWDVSATTFSTGEAFMRDGSTLSQTVLLKPDDESTSHIYTIRAVARLLATGSYTGQIGKSVTLNYQYPVLGDVTEVGTIDSALVAANGTNVVSGDVELDYPYTLETTIEIAEDTDSAFTFSVVVEDSDNYIQGLRLDSVCIDPEGDGSFPGQGGDGGYTPPFIVGCSVVPIPLENSIGPWIFYHWANLRRFFTCDLMKLLNKWFSLFDQFRTTMLKVARWWIALVHYGSNWLSSFLWYLNGSFRNMALGQVTTITEEGGCHDIFCSIVDVVTTLGNLLTPVVAALNGVVGVLLSVFVSGVSLFFTLITGLVGFVVALVIKLVLFLQTAGALLSGIIGAYNTATPVAIPGLPLCATDPTSNIICTGVWVTDNTIFSGRWGTLFAIILSVASIHLILWAIAEFKQILLKTWGSS